MNFLTLFVVFSTQIFYVDSVLLTCGPCLCYSDFTRGICAARHLTVIPDLGTSARQQMTRLDLRRNNIKTVNFMELSIYEAVKISIDISQQLTGCVNIIGTVPQNIILLTDEICTSTTGVPTYFPTEETVIKNMYTETVIDDTVKGILQDALNISNRLSPKMTEINDTIIIPFITVETCNVICYDIVGSLGTTIKDEYVEGVSTIVYRDLGTTVEEVTDTTTVSTLTTETYEKGNVDYWDLGTTAEEVSDTTTVSTLTTQTYEKGNVDIQVTSVTDGELEQIEQSETDQETTEVQDRSTTQVDQNNTLEITVSPEITNTYLSDINIDNSSITEIPILVFSNVIPTITMGNNQSKQLKVFVLLAVFFTIFIIFIFGILIFGCRKLIAERQRHVYNARNIELTDRVIYRRSISELESGDVNLEVVENPHYSLVSFTPPPPALPPINHYPKRTLNVP